MQSRESVMPMPATRVPDSQIKIPFPGSEEQLCVGLKSSSSF
jgi:hypothetical protein